MLRIGTALDTLAAELDDADLCFGHGCDNAWDEAVCLTLSVLDLPLDSSDGILSDPLPAAAWKHIQTLARRRIEERVPLPYLLGRAWFADLEFACDARALVPRSPLAEVIRHAYAPWWVGGRPSRLLDLCCGGGAIGIAAAVYDPELSVVLADLSKDALALARENIARHAVGDRVTATHSDLFSGLAGEVFDLILCNPPYVDADDLRAMPAEFQAEPALGLGSGKDGLNHARSVLQEAAGHLSGGGLLFLELGNSWVSLDAALAPLPVTWLDFADGGHGVLVATKPELDAIAAALRRAPREAYN